MQKLTGFLFINKQENITSYDCIRHIKKILPKNIKIGHAGTLDPFASGLLIIAISRESTKQLNKLINLDKEYIATAKFGFETDTLDITGNTTNISSNIIKKDILDFSIEKIKENYIQIPPVYSAKKYKGQNLYQLARDNKLNKDTLENIAKEKAKKVNIYSLDILTFNYPDFEIKTKVSSGTYIRSLINDIAKLNNNFATVLKLKRLSIGSYRLQDSCNIFDLKSLQDIIKNLKDL